MSVKALTVTIIITMGAWCVLPSTSAVAQEEAEKVSKPEKLAMEAGWALGSLFEKEPAAKTLAEKAQAILVFPRITRASLGVGVQRGTGTLLKDGSPEGFYNTTGTSVGLQAGAKTYGYALFFMNDNAVQALGTSQRLRGGCGPERCRGQQGSVEEPHDDDAQVRHLCGHFRPEGPHGRRRDPGEQNHEGEPQIADERHQGRKGPLDRYDTRRTHVDTDRPSRAEDPRGLLCVSGRKEPTRKEHREQGSIAPHCRPGDARPDATAGHHARKGTGADRFWCHRRHRLSHARPTRRCPRNAGLPARSHEV